MKFYHGRGWLRDILIMAINLRVPLDFGQFLSSITTGGLAKRSGLNAIS